MKTLISIVGTTGIGKTKLAIALAKHLNTEIISCDSRQFFKEMKIGTATPSAQELSDAKHHFIAHLSIKEYYSIGQYEIDALAKIKEIFSKNEFCIMVGGSMMYEKAVIQGLNDLPEANEENQKKLYEIWQTKGIETLQNILENLDEEYYKKVDINNPRRLLRAIDVIWQTKTTYTELTQRPLPKRNFQTIRIGIEAPREIIYDRINTRVDAMMKAGLLDEVKTLAHQNRNLTALKTVGYTELFDYIDGKTTLEEAIGKIKINTRRFAKRQLTWYRNEENIHWVSYKNSQEESVHLLNRLLK